MSGPKIQVSADLSSFQQELDKLNNSVAQLGDKLKTESGRAEFNFSGAQGDLNKLIAQTEKLTKALESGDKKSATYVKNLKEMAKALEQAAKVSSKLESAGSSSNNNASNYFREFAGEVRNDAGDTSSQLSIQRERERTQARQEQEAQARRERVTRHLSGMIGAAGNLASGAGGYSQFGSLVGGLLPGPMGFVGSQLLGGAGAFVDKYSGSNKSEAINYSELSRSLDGITVEFQKLRDSVRGAVSGFNVTNEKSAELAKNFSQIAALSEDANYDIARSVGGSAALAQGYGISADQTVGFAANMRLNGVTKNSEDNKRLALQIGEAVGRANQSSKFSEVIESIGKFVSGSAAQSLSTPNYADFASILTGMIGSKYSGLHGNVDNASSIIAKADAGVRNGGSMGEASENHWLFSRQEAFKGFQWQDNQEMAGQGLLGDLSATYKPGNLIFDNASDEDKKRRSEFAETIDKSGFKNNLQVMLAHAKKISRTAAEERENIKAMLGLDTIAQAETMKAFGSNYKGMGDLEKKIGKPLKDIDQSKIPEYAAVIEGSGDDRKKYYQNIKKNLSKSDLEIGEKALSAGGDDLKNFLISAIDKKPNDAGLEAQLSSISIENKMAASLDSLVGIETAAKDILLGLLKQAAPDSPYLKKIEDKQLEEIKKDIPEDGTNMTGEKGYDRPLPGSQERMMKEVDAGLLKISQAGTQEEKDAEYNKFMQDVSRYPKRYPKQTIEWAKKARGGHAVASDKPVLPIAGGNEEATLPATTPGAEVAPTKPAASSNDSVPTKPAASSNDIVPAKPANQSSKGLTKRQKDVADMVKSETRYDNLFKEAGEATGVDPLVVKQLAAQESGINPNATNKNSNGTTDLGMMQHNSKYAGDRGINDKNWNDPKANIMAGAKFFKTLLNKSKGNYREAFRRYNGTGEKAEKYADNAMATYHAVHSKQSPIVIASAKPDDFASKFSWSAIKKDTMDAKPKDFLDYLIKPASANEMDQLPSDYKQPASRSENNNMSFNHSIDVRLYDQNNRPIASPSTISTHIGAPRAAGAH